MKGGIGVEAVKIPASRRSRRLEDLGAALRSPLLGRLEKTGWQRTSPDKRCTTVTINSCAQRSRPVGVETLRGKENLAPGLFAS